MQRYTYLRLIDPEQIQKIFKGGIDSEVFIKIVETFRRQVIENPEFNNATEQLYIYQFLEYITKSDSFDFALGFLEASEKQGIKAVV